MLRRFQLLGLVTVGCAVASCSSSSGEIPRAEAGSEINVHVAASLSDVFTALGNEFRTQFPDVKVSFNFAGSSTLVTQIQQGAPADVVVVADSVNMDKLVTSGDVAAGEVEDLAYNELAILVAQGNPLKIDALDDLASRDTRVVLCDDAQPCGKYATTMLTAAGVVVEPASREANAAAVVSRIANGEADAGISYLTDGLRPNDNVDAVRLPKSMNVTTNYPIAPLAEPSSRDDDIVSAFIDFARGTIGDQLLSDAGFTLP